MVLGAFSFRNQNENTSSFARLAGFGNQWIKTTDGPWIKLTKARFTHTARVIYKDRLDRGVCNHWQPLLSHQWRIQATIH